MNGNPWGEKLSFVLFSFCVRLISKTLILLCEPLLFCSQIWLDWEDCHITTLITLLISTGGSTPLLCLEGLPDLPVAPQDEAGLWCWEGLGSGGKGDDRGWDGWMASLTQWIWVWVNSGRWWWTRRPGVLWFMGSQRVGHDWVTELTEQQYLAHIMLIELQDLEKCDRLENSKWFQKMNFLSLENSTTCEMSCISQVTL